MWAQTYPRDNVPHSNWGVIYGYLGQYEKAVTEIQQALRLNPDSALGYTNLVSHYAALNQLEEAKAIFHKAEERKLDNPYLHLNLYGVAFLQGDAGEMQKQTDWAAGKVQSEDLLLSGELPTIRAALEINGKNPGKAIEILRVATPYELGNPLPQAEIGAFLYPVYLRGQSYLQLRQGQEAAAEFQKFHDHRGITLNSPLGVLAQLGSARAYALQGDKAKARAAYGEFFGLWKDADSDLRLLKEAKMEFAKL